MVITEYEENRKLSFVSEKIYVESKFIPSDFLDFLSQFFKVKIEMERIFEVISDKESILYTKHRFGSEVPIIGRFVNLFIDKFVFPSKYHEDHLKEEAEYMKEKIEFCEFK